jgi:multicomponent Na+:H+ antiporter subunit D
MTAAGALTAVPPGLVLLAAALLVPFLSRRAGHALGLVATLGILAWVAVVPEGVYLPARFLGFEAVLFHVDEASRLMGLIFAFIAAAAVLYSYSSEAENLQTAFALGYAATSLGAVFAGDWLTLLFFWELMAIASTLLVWHYRGRAVRAGFRYALWHGLGGSLLMGAITLHYTAVGSFLFADSTGITSGLAAALAAIGIGVNVGFVGLHVWLPDTYPRPHIAASVFLCVYTTKTGVYGMARVFPEGHLWIAYMGGAMAVVGVTYALFQNDMRRLLSYHIQSQVGYMIAGVGIGTSLATAGAFAHVFNHILYKGLLFMTVGVVIYRTGEENLKQLGGLWRSMPLTALAFTIAALSIAGFPGFNGFVSKGMVITAAHYKHLDALWWMLIIGGVGTFMSFIKLGYYAFFRSREKAHVDVDVRDAKRGQTVAMLTVAALCVLYGVYPDALFALLPGEGASEAHPFTLSHLAEGFALAAAGLIGFVLVKKPLERVHGVPDLDAIYNPLGFYGARTVVRGVTETYAAVDRLAVAAAEYGMTLSARPRDVAGNLLPERADIGDGVLLVVLGFTALVVVLLAGVSVV